MYGIAYLESVVKKDIPRLPKSHRKSIKTAIERRLAISPIEFGKPLQYNLKGLRCLRVGDYRIIYKIEASKNIVLVVKIGHRKDVYKL